MKDTYTITRYGWRDEPYNDYKLAVEHAKALCDIDCPNVLVKKNGKTIHLFTWNYNNTVYDSLA
jgi:hypothetical protein